MELLWWVAPAAVAIFGALFVLSGTGHLFGGRFGRGSRHMIGGTGATAIGVVLSLVALNTQLFARLTHEGAVANVIVKSIDPAQDKYLVTLRRLDGQIPDQSCSLQGDQWLIGGEVQKWKPWANVLGLDATYTLDQISNKYFTAERGNGKLITACDLKGAPEVNKYVPDAWLPWLLDHFYTADRRFGSANYMPLADGAVYRIVITQSGFNAEPQNDVAKTASAAQH